MKIYFLINHYSILIEMIDNSKIFYEPNKLYCFTINPCDKYQFFGHADRMAKCSNYLYEKLLAGLDPFAHYVAYIEVSEPHGDINAHSEGPRIHIHGTFVLKSKLLTKKFLLNGMWQLLKESKCDFDVVTHANTWAKYITKQHDIIRKQPFSNNSKMIVESVGSSDDEDGNDFLTDDSITQKTKSFHLERSKQRNLVSAKKKFRSKKASDEIFQMD